MARLLGVVAGEAADLRMSVAEAPAQFAKLGQNNPDGWGLGYFVDGKAEVCKHELPAQGGIPPQQAEASARSSLFVAHVRRGSRAPRAARNTHPFSAGGWVFAHTGALYPLLEVAVRRLAGRDRSYEGQTDSEALFHLLLSKLERVHAGDAPALQAGRQRDSATTAEVSAIHEALEPILADGQFSGLNFLLARRELLYAFRYAARSADYYSLWWRLRQPGRPLDARSRDNFAHFHSAGLADTPAVLACSEQIEDGEWRALEMGELLVVRQPGPQTETVKLF